jgi:hypothetical protein
MYVHVYTNDSSLVKTHSRTYKNWATPPARCEVYQTEKFEADKLNLCGKLVNWPVAMMGISLKNRNLFSASVTPSSLPIIVPRRTHIRSLNSDFWER